ncbi:MAG: DUF3313 family protein [Candidatus Binatia bacterium]|nr:DUF3313 family protein [Candidatus Binatia bacterium]
MVIRRSIFVVGFLVLAACAGTKKVPSPPLFDPGDVTVDGLYRVKDARMAAAYLRPGADLASYDKVKLDLVSISYKSPPKGNQYDRSRANFPLTKEEIARADKLFYEAFAEELAKSSYQLVDQTGPDVLSLEAELIDLVVKAPPQSTTGTSWVFVQSAGELTLVAELHDSVTGATLARIADRRAVQSPGAGAGGLYYSSPVSNWSDLRRVFSGWARQLREALDEARALKAVSVTAN